MENEGNQIHNFILCVCENFCDTILLRFRFRLFDKLRFLRFRFYWLAQRQQSWVQSQHPPTLRTADKAVLGIKYKKLGRLAVQCTYWKQFLIINLKQDINA
jgi:hypothetical protein